MRHSLAEVGEGGGGSGLDLALGYSGEKASESDGEVAGGGIGAGEVEGDICAGYFAGEGLGFLAGMIGAEPGMVLARDAATAAVREGEGTQRGTIGGASRHRSLQEKNF